MDRTPIEQLEDLTQQTYSIDEDVIDNEIYDECMMQARRKYEELRDMILLDKLEFLHKSGYTLQRIHELMEEAKQ